MGIAVRRLPHLSALNQLHLHVQAGQLSACHVKCHVTICFGALDTSTHSLVADIAGEFPAGWRNVADSVDRLEKDRICKLHFGDPDCTDDVCPFRVDGLLEGSALVRA